MDAFSLAEKGSRISAICAQAVREGAEEETQRSRAASKETDISRRRVLSSKVETFAITSEQVGRLAMLAQDGHP